MIIHTSGTVLINLKRFRKIEWVRIFLKEHHIKIDAEYFMEKKEKGYTKIYLDSFERDFVLAYCLKDYENIIFFTDDLRIRLESLKPLNQTKLNDFELKNEKVASVGEKEENFIHEIEFEGRTNEEILNLILEKISKHGIDSLSKFERALLNAFSS